jgi:hypothetical protein
VRPYFENIQYKMGLVESLLSKYKALSSNPVLKKKKKILPALLLDFEEIMLCEKENK